MHIESSYNLTLCLLAYLFDQEGQQIFQNGGTHYVCIRQDILFRQITTFIKVRVAFDQTHQLIYSSKIYQLKGLKPKNKGHSNFYECCDLTKKVYLNPIFSLHIKFYDLLLIYRILDFRIYPPK